MKNFFIRTLTGIALVVIILGGTLLHPVSFFMVQMLVMVASLFEYYRLVERDNVRPNRLIGIATGLLSYLISVAVASGIISPVGYILLIPLLIALMVAELYRKNDRPFDSIAQTISGIVYIALPWSLIPFSAFTIEGFGTILSSGLIGFSPAPIFSLFILLWANDTGAYLFGISFGKHRLLERVSPGKTWEGLIGGVLTTLAVAWALSGCMEFTSLPGWLIIAFLVSVGGTMGDLVESLLKRGAAVKDSGSFLPGHGGVLDRFDSILFAWPLMYLFLTFFG